MHAEAWTEAPEVEGDCLAAGLEEAPSTLALVLFAQMHLKKNSESYFLTFFLHVHMHSQVQGA